MSSKGRFLTAKDEKILPIVTNKNIYRAGQTPHWNKNGNDKSDDDENEEEMIANSYYLSDKLASTQEPTFVDAIKHRKDHYGRLITKSKLIRKTNKNKKKLKSISPPPTTSIDTNHDYIVHKINDNEIKTKLNENNNNHTNDDNQPQQQDDDEEEEEEEDFDFDLDNMAVPEVENENEINGDIENEGDNLRQKFREKLKLRQQQEQESAPIVVQNDNDKEGEIDDEDEEDEEDDDSDSDEEESSEYETDSDDSEDEQPRKRNLAFLKASDRAIIYENRKQISMEQEAELIEQLEEERKIEIAKETRDETLNYIREQEKREKEEHDNSDDELPSDSDDDIDGEEGQKEFELWKIREIKRNLRDEKFRQERENEKIELEKRRNMTDKEIILDNKRLGIKQPKKKGKMKFMQKYYHQGVFYRDNTIVEERILDRNFNAPTGKDKYINYENVPNAMKKKNFGKMSQSKWTHLAAEDTSNVKDDYKFAHKQYSNNFWFKRGGTDNVNNNDRFQKHDHYKRNKRKQYDDRDKEDDDDDRDHRHRSPPHKSRRYR